MLAARSDAREAIMADLDLGQHKRIGTDQGITLVRSMMDLVRLLQASGEGDDGQSDGHRISARPDSVRAAQRALNAARQAIHDARERAAVGAPDTAAAIDDAAQRYERAMALLRDAREPGRENRRSRS